ncbi:hypothetical protein A2865_02355 [Candidatus Woesebacteria bacterium RIFCSPHIGHO2_01_FULL_39_17]|uniref:Uncharacterized protein n=3 Tax=Candidatus Woeseibacteriota TaxID=1752722 RepID=A0A0G0NEQ9_9BACT|nr:MAG: hypothetical protein US72_C0009G0036 [Microgenomates group bacterium GW2011_GWC1_38_12]KKQ93924.1 MAG: hypothetical protein UT19_C0006G0052 [Candidatus Woesebacteria bacterium GW2011_GWB1_39_10b]KKR13993.1 MAG: hypothetical protein UT40_C0007G0035 [Candidatus Woesebacteria bacterium GW2011_GWA1_39_21b]OGM23485.1 MAG: hypothetical protein A2865_02355 [Candidatus Woesebacteria bacterium RIFCSPHIGHO2_01_FULL_39_17]OGM64274.1 MAG: hypothetical protein A3A52_03180 [Candidatus Woesebacteria b
MRLRHYLIFSLTIAGLFFLAEKVRASEGTVELRSTTVEPYRCWAASVRMQNQEYRIPFTCKYLIYPADENIFNYVVWATPKEGGNPIKLGTLGLGKGEFKTKKSFTGLFVTTEMSKETKTPQGQTVMKGEIKEVEFLEEAATPTPTPAEEEEAVSEEEKVEAPVQALSTRQKLLLALRRAGIAALVALVAIIGLIFVVTRSRG